MTRPVHPFRDAMAHLARESLRGAEHPSPRKIVAYQRGELAPQEASALTEHLSLCRECTELLLEAMEFLEDDGDEEEAVEARKTDAAWEALQAARGAVTARPSVEVPAPPLASGALRARPNPAPPAAPVGRPVRPFLSRLSTAYGSAAAFALLSLGLVFSSMRTPATAPSVDESLYDLVSAGSERGPLAPVTTIRFAAPDSSALLILNPEASAAFGGKPERYGARLLDSQRRISWTSDRLEPQSLGAFHLTLFAKSFPPGRYVLELYGLRGGREAVLGSYPIQIER